MKYIYLICLLFPFLSLSVQAQTNASSVNATDNPADEIIVTGKRRGADPAMDAFLSGDYETAEIEFEKNFNRLRRSERLAESAFLQSQRDLLAARNNLASTSATPGRGSSGGQSATAASANVFNLNVTRRADGADKDLISSGTDLGQQLYMRGLSQVQLKKYTEARVSFKRALRLNRDIFDAHLRLGILELRLGDKKAANKHLYKLRKLSNRCNPYCNQHEDIKESLKTLEWALAKA